MSRPRKRFPDFVSISITDLSIFAANISDEDFGRWCRKALLDMLTDCVANDVDPMVSKVYSIAKDRMNARQEIKHNNYESKKSGKPASSTSISNDVLDAVKRDDQLIFGKFENVFLSQTEFNELAQMMGNINEIHQVIENFSAALSDGTRHSRNHFATLSYWINYRKQKGSTDAPQTRCGFEQNNVRALANAKAQLRDMVDRGLIK